MKIMKGISIFFLYTCIVLGVGMVIGFRLENYFYPGDAPAEKQSQTASIPLEDMITTAEEEPASGVISQEAIAYGVSRAVASVEETLCVDTKYVLKEMDMIAGTTEETSYRIPTKYVGMTRKQFIDAMDTYALAPPLSELERGFVDLEVLSFSRERVVVQMNYKFLQPGNGFFLAVFDNRVIVYLEDKETVYIETDIKLETLPVELQASIVEMLWMEDEQELYGFLESYSS